MNPQLYEFLAQALLYPDAAFVARMQARSQALSQVPRWAQQMLGTLAGESLEDLQVEHVRLFVNAHGGVPCPPYESVYADGHLLGQAAQQVAALYAQWGLEEATETPDHAAVELAFAAHLARQQAKKWPGREISRRTGTVSSKVTGHSEAEQAAVARALEAFEQDHLRRWLPRLATDLQQAARLPFYQALGTGLNDVFA